MKNPNIKAHTVKPGLPSAKESTTTVDMLVPSNAVYAGSGRNEIVAFVAPSATGTLELIAGKVDARTIADGKGNRKLEVFAKRPLRLPVSQAGAFIALLQSALASKLTTTDNIAFDASSDIE